MLAADWETHISISYIKINKLINLKKKTIKPPIKVLTQVLSCSSERKTYKWFVYSFKTVEKLTRAISG